MASVSGSGFDAGAFRDGVHFAMNMGLPPTVSSRATFLFKSTTTYPVGTALDSEGKPFDLSIAPIVVSPDPVQIPCAVEFVSAWDKESPVGVFESTKAIITILDTEWSKVKDAVEVKLGGNTYAILYQEPPLGLFDVEIYRLRCEAKDET